MCKFIMFVKGGKKKNAAKDTSKEISGMRILSSQKKNVP